MFRYHISRNLVVGLVLLIFLIISVSFSVIWLEGRPKLIALTLDSQIRLGQNISLSLEKEMEEVKGLTRAIAASAASLGNKDLSALSSIVPTMLQPKGDEHIYAGGGVWPEPYAFDSSKGRNSLFWAQNRAGKLELLEDYNQPHGPGYHSEEWYVPAGVLESDVYWSKSYTDPYSQQPMVTCTAPIRRQGEFIGVATVDLKLEGVAEALNRIINGMDAYSFVVDRNNRFIVFPILGFDVSRAQVYSGTNAFEYLSDLVRAYPGFKQIEARLNSMDKSLYQDMLVHKPEYTALVNRISQGSYQIDDSEAERILAHHWLQEKSSGGSLRPLDVFEIPNDLLLRGDATGVVYQMPSTNWRIVTVFERKAYGAISDLVSQKLFGAILMPSLIFGVLALVFLKVGIIDRITRMVAMLSEAAEESDGKSLKLKYDKKDELGLLAYWFNHRTDQLEQAIKTSKRANRAKSDFLTAMSQELRTPIKSIIGFNRRLIVKLGGDLEEQNYKTLVGVQRSAHHLLGLIDDILEVSELEAGKVKLKFDWESVNMLLDDATSQMVGQISDANLNFELIPLKDDVRVFADRQKIIQVLLHLLANAVNATKEGCVTMKAEPMPLAEHDAIAFSVIDTGVGLSNEEKHRIYRQFSQVDEHVGIEKGMGLGLYLIREITALHHGAVFFESSLDVGSTFRVLIPISTNLSQIDDQLDDLTLDK
ncbi:MAG: diguanylate cyclase [Agarilytica sp.]